VIPIVLAVAVVLCAGTSMAKMKGDANIILGSKWFGSDYEIDEDILYDKQDSTLGIDLTQQMEYGVVLNFGKVDWPVAIAVDVLYASDDDQDSFTYDYTKQSYTYGIKLETTTTEVAVGVRKFFLPDGKFQPYIGGGVDWIMADAKLTAYYEGTSVPLKQASEEFVFVDDSESTIGFFLNGGVMWRLGERINLGLDIRYSDGSVDFEAEDLLKQTTTTESVDVGGTHAGIVFGFRF
jgi:opacity protein-like surface antigen